MTIETISAEQYAIERAICDKAEAYARATMAKRGKNCNYLTAEESAHPDYAPCTNDMRGRVEQYEILRDLPEVFCAYVGAPAPYETQLRITTWTGHKLGNATRGKSWRSNSAYGLRMYQFYAWIGGRQYTGRGFGEGMSIVLRETAESKRKNPR